MKEITTTTVRTEVIRRAPRKKTISSATHSVVDGQILVTATYAPQCSLPAPKFGSKAVPYIGMSETRQMIRSGVIAPGKDAEALGMPGYNLSETLLHMAAMRDGIMGVTKLEIAKEDKERLQIIAAQLNEFIPIIKDMLLKQASGFAASIQTN